MIRRLRITRESVTTYLILMGSFAVIVGAMLFMPTHASAMTVSNGGAYPPKETHPRIPISTQIDTVPPRAAEHASGFLASTGTDEVVLIDVAVFLLVAGGTFLYLGRPAGAR